MIGRKSEIIRSFDHIEGFSVETEEKNYPGWDCDDALSTGDVFFMKDGSFRAMYRECWGRLVNLQLTGSVMHSVYEIDAIL